MYSLLTASAGRVAQRIETPSLPSPRMGDGPGVRAKLRFIQFPNGLENKPCLIRTLKTDLFPNTFAIRNSNFEIRTAVL